VKKIKESDRNGLIITGIVFFGLIMLFIVGEYQLRLGVILAIMGLVVFFLLPDLFK